LKNLLSFCKIGIIRETDLYKIQHYSGQKFLCPETFYKENSHGKTCHSLLRSMGRLET
jgi:hypothetical protein